MKLSLTYKLILAFLLVGLTGTVLMAFFARQATINEFDRLVLDQIEQNFTLDVISYYQLHNSWAGLDDFMRQRRPPILLPPSNNRSDQRRPPPPPPDAKPPLLLVDTNRQVILPSRPYRLGDRLPAHLVSQGQPIEVNGQTVGTVINLTEGQSFRPWEREYMNRINGSFVRAALGATVIALLLGIFLARNLTRPLRELTIATQALAKGKLQQQVTVRTNDELGELAASFNKMSADLTRANQLRRQMTADIAHDLRTPLSVIKGYTEALSEGVLPPTPETFQVMHQEAEHLSRLVEDLRTLSLADADELNLNRSLTLPNELLNRTAAAHQHQAQQLAIVLQVQAPPDLPPIWVDPERMAQVLGNLVRNALRYTPANGQITLTAQLNGSSTQPGEMVILQVQDTGSGIEPALLPHIFERFYRADASRQHHEGEASGLGLAIVKSIVEAHGGTISVTSQLDYGTTFEIALPQRMMDEA